MTKDLSIITRFAIASAVLSWLSFLAGSATHQMLSQPPIVDGVKTWYEPSYIHPMIGRRVAASIRHNVYPASGRNWFSVHTPGAADACELCEGRGARDRDDR